MLFQTDGIVLDQSDLGENDRLAIVFTKEEGLLKAVVKGAGRPKSKLRGLTQPFTYSSFQLFKGKSFDRVTQVSVYHAYPGIMEGYDKMIYARYLAELLIAVLPERAKDQGQFDFFLSIMSCLEERADSWIIVRWAELGILSLAGFAPSFSYCTSCGKDRPEAPVYFSLRDGGAVCCDCVSAPNDVSAKESQLRSYGQFIPISQGTLRTLQILTSEANLNPFGNRLKCPNINALGQVRKEITLVLRKYIAFVLEKRLKSAALVESIEDEE